MPREFINSYLFNFPDTSFAWAFVLVLLAAALAARKRIAWWILVFYMVAASVWNITDLVTGDETAAVDVGEVIGLVFHVAAAGALVLAYKEFWARVRRGALLKAAAALVAGMAVGTLIGWMVLEFFPGTLARDDRLLVRAQPGQRVRRCRRRILHRPSAHLRQRPARPVRRAGVDGGRGRAVPIPARRERTDRRGRVRHPRSAAGVRQERLAGLLRHPPRQVGGVRRQRPRRDHLPRRGRGVPGQR